MQQDVQGKVDSRAMREVNRSIVLDIIRRGGQVSRTDLAKSSTLTKPTVSAIVDDLIARGIVSEVGFSKTLATGGRRARLLELNDAAAAYLGLCFGTQTTTVAVADARGEVRASRETPAIGGEPLAAVSSALALVDSVLADAALPRERLGSVGVTLPGMVDTRGNGVAFAPSLGWTDVSIRELLTQALRLPVVLHNATNAAALAEGRVGAAKGARSYVWVNVGHGIGAAIVVDGRLFSGGEPTLLSAHAAPELAAVSEAAGAGDALAPRVLREAGQQLGIGLSYLINVLDPELVVLGGRVMEAADLILEGARASVARHALRASRVAVVPSALGERAGLMGSVISAMDQAVRSYRIVATDRFA